MTRVEAVIVTPLELVTDFLGVSALIYLGCYQFYLRKNVDRLELQGKVTPEAAIRIRKKPMIVSGWALILSGTILFALVLFKLI